MYNLTNIFGGNEVAGQLSKEQFFANYFGKTEFISYVKKLTGRNRQELAVLIDKLAAEQRIEISPFISIDKGHQSYRMGQFRGARGNTSVKIVMTPQIEKFLADYVNGTIIPVFNLMDLITAAQN